MAKAGISLSELARQIEERANAKKDFVAPVDKFTLSSPIVGDPKDVRLVIANGGEHTLGLNTVAHGQLAEYVGIPNAYYQRMLADQPALLTANVNTWLRSRSVVDNKAPTGGRADRRMIRTIGGTARAILSDKYRPLENEDLAEAILPVLLDMNLMLLSCQITDTRLYIKAVDRRIEKDVPTGKKMGDGSHVFFDTCSPAITITNSEVGMGALSIETGVFTRVCTNLCMIGTNLRKMHTGGRASVSDEVYELLSDDTRKKTDGALWGQVRDLVRAAFDRARFEAVCGKLGDAAEQPLGNDPVLVIERAGKRLGLLEGEKKGILARLIEGADLTRYGLHSAITRHAEDVEDYDRASHLERLGGEVIELPKHSWQEIVREAA